LASKIFGPSFCPLLTSVILIILISAMFSLEGCASRKEVIGLQYEINSLKRQTVNLKKNIKKDSVVKADEFDVKIRGVEGNIKDSIRPVRKNQADIHVRLDNLRIQLRSLKGRVEECQYLLNQVSKERKAYESELEKRLLLLEGFFISEDHASGGDKYAKDKNYVRSEEKRPTEDKKPISKELYSKAYNNFKKGDIKEARKGFQEYLRLFPNTSYSDNAKYWLGESFFIEKKYREAILEFEEVIRKYPKGNKVPGAMLKQGLAFYRLGDKTSAKLLLQKVVKEYPGSNQAKIAKKELKKLM